MISAQVICDSVSKEDVRITTFSLRYPRFIHSEFMTHRVFSRNASSSRAVPTKKLLEEVRSPDLRAYPVFWGKNQAGMQAVEELDDITKEYSIIKWNEAANSAANYAESMMHHGVHKQIVNRILEPFLHINVIITATQFMNFFGLRLDAGAQPEIKVLAEHMWEAMRRSTPNLLELDQWHLPYVEPQLTDVKKPESTIGLTELIKMSVARCARVSYKSFETGKLSTLEEDLKLYDRLLGNDPIHASPAEHQATPDARCVCHGKWLTKEDWGNFFGWKQYRKTLQGEHCAPLPKEYSYEKETNNHHSGSSTEASSQTG